MYYNSNHTPNYHNPNPSEFGAILTFMAIVALLIAIFG